MKIVNFRRFLTFIIGGIILILIFISLFNTKSLSRVEINYIDFEVASNDTLWEIAKTVKSNNINYENKDIREIVFEIKNINNLETSDLYANQVITIPEI